MIRGWSDGGFQVARNSRQQANNGGPAQQNGISDHGSFGMHWHQVVLYVDDNGGTAGAPLTQVFADGLYIGKLDGGYLSNGSVALSYSDPTSNQSDLPTHSFALIDNLSVETGVPEPATITLLIPAGMMLIARRRRA